MTDVLWEKVDRLIARVKQLELITAVAWGVVQGLAIWALIGAAIAVVIVAIRLVLRWDEDRRGKEARVRVVGRFIGPVADHPTTSH